MATAAILKKINPYQHNFTWMAYDIATRFHKGSFWVLNKIQNGGRCHGNQGAKNVIFTPSFTNVCSIVSCHIRI
jgi:hypothetical protein